MFQKDEITLCNIGDSKVFRLSEGELEQISIDRCIVRSVRKTASDTEIRNTARFLIEPYLAQGVCKEGDRYLICSDGLTDMLSDDEITEHLSEENREGATQTFCSDRSKTAVEIISLSFFWK